MEDDGPHSSLDSGPAAGNEEADREHGKLSFTQPASREGPAWTASSKEETAALPRRCGQPRTCVWPHGPQTSFTKQQKQRTFVLAFPLPNTEDKHTHRNSQVT